MSVKVTYKPKHPGSDHKVLTAMGIDVSTQTGLVVLKYDYEHHAWRCHIDLEVSLPSLPKTASMTQRIDRCRHLQKEVVSAVILHQPTVTVIEGYGYANAHSLVTLVELGSAVRLGISEVYGPPGTLGRPVVEVSPATLKKFVLGKGVGAKELVMMHVFKRWGFEPPTNNIADAYVLAQIGAALLIDTPHPKPQTEVLKLLRAQMP